MPYTEDKLRTKTVWLIISVATASKTNLRFCCVYILFIIINIIRICVSPFFIEKVYSLL